MTKRGCVRLPSQVIYKVELPPLAEERQQKITAAAVFMLSKKAHLEEAAALLLMHMGLMKGEPPAISAAEFSARCEAWVIAHREQDVET